MAKILVIEDDNLVQQQLKDFLEEQGHEVLQAFDGDEGWKMIKDESPDKLILDLALPKKDGYHILASMDGDKIPVIILSAIDSESSKKECLAEGALAYILKGDDFLGELKNVLL